MMSNKTFLGSLIIIGIALLTFSYVVNADDITDEYYSNYCFSVANYNRDWYDCVDSATGTDFVYPRDIIEDAIYSGQPISEYKNARFFYVFDTSNLPDNANITEVYLNIYLVNPSNNPAAIIMLGNNEKITSPDSDCYNDFYDLTLCRHFTIDGSGLFEIELINQDNNNNYSFVNKTGITTLVLREYTYDYGYTEPKDTVYTFAITDQELWFTYDPILEVTYNLPSCNSVNLTMYENIINATGTHQSKYNNLTGWKVWANYTGNNSGTGCTGIVWVNYTDTNLSFNVSVNKADNSNTSSYIINEDSWFSLLTGSIMFDDTQLFLFILLTLWIYFLKEYLDKRNSPNGSMLAKIQLALAFPLTIQLAIISFSFVFGYILVFIIPVLAIYIFLDSTIYMKNNKK